VVLKNICKINPYKTTIAEKAKIVLALKPLLIKFGTNGPKKTKNTKINSV